MENQDVTQKAPRTEPAKSTLPQPGRPIPSRAYPGALIVVEGTDGSGKSTQLYLLKRWLEIGGYPLSFRATISSSPIATSTPRSPATPPAAALIAGSAISTVSLPSPTSPSISAL